MVAQYLDPSHHGPIQSSAAIVMDAVARNLIHSPEGTYDVIFHSEVHSGKRLCEHRKPSLVNRNPLQCSLGSSRLISLSARGALLFITAHHRCVPTPPPLLFKPKTSEWDNMEALSLSRKGADERFSCRLS
ncbi:hypothetical protein NPIL_396511 [Nephila pilipes]|uniref:Uncharacterized protein n=1 Tax=Nephila pilipes TaxID=299642 RepID=A0A8X6N0A4_NEPPI|nr:hypothetical protein NPIL_396511 [Nephila pilipes]